MVKLKKVAGVALLGLGGLFLLGALKKNETIDLPTSSGGFLFEDDGLFTGAGVNNQPVGSGDDYDYLVSAIKDANSSGNFFTETVSTEPTNTSSSSGGSWVGRASTSSGNVGLYSGNELIGVEDATAQQSRLATPAEKLLNQPIKSSYPLPSAIDFSKNIPQGNNKDYTTQPKIIKKKLNGSYPN